MIAAASEGAGMKRLLAGLALVPLLASAAASATFFVEPFGDDANDCSYKAACATMQHVVDKRCPSTEPCLVQLARGIYHQKVSVIYHRVVSFVGDCRDRKAVVDDDKAMIDGLPCSKIKQGRPAYLTITFDYEGGYSNDPGDPGGQRNWHHPSNAGLFLFFTPDASSDGGFVAV